MEKDFDLKIINDFFKMNLKEEGITVFKIINSYAKFNKSLLIYVFLSTNFELNQLSEEQKIQIEGMYINLLKKYNIIPAFIERTEFHLDSDENVQIKYGGNYFYATR